MGRERVLARVLRERQEGRGDGQRALGDRFLRSGQRGLALRQLRYLVLVPAAHLFWSIARLIGEQRDAPVELVDVLFLSRLAARQVDRLLGAGGESQVDAQQSLSVAFHREDRRRTRVGATRFGRRIVEMPEHHEIDAGIARAPRQVLRALPGRAGRNGDEHHRARPLLLERGGALLDAGVRGLTGREESDGNLARAHDQRIARAGNAALAGVEQRDAAGGVRAELPAERQIAGTDRAGGGAQHGLALGKRPRLELVLGSDGPGPLHCRFK